MSLGLSQGNPYHPRLSHRTHPVRYGMADTKPPTSNEYKEFLATMYAMKRLIDKGSDSQQPIDKAMKDRWQKALEQLEQHSPSFVASINDLKEDIQKTMPRLVEKQNTLYNFSQIFNVYLDRESVNCPQELKAFYQACPPSTPKKMGSPTVSPPTEPPKARRGEAQRAKRLGGTYTTAYRTVADLPSDVQYHLSSTYKWRNKKDLNLNDPNALVGANLKELQINSKQAIDLQSINFEDAVLQSCWIPKAQLQGANLAGADLSPSPYASHGSTMDSSNATGACFEWADLREVVFNKSTFDNTDFRHTDLTHAELQATTAHQANFEDAFMPRSWLINADVKKSNFKRANLSFADLKGTDFTGACLEDTMMFGAVANEKTKWPTPDFNYKAHGIVMVDKKGQPIDELLAELRKTPMLPSGVSNTWDSFFPGNTSDTTTQYAYSVLNKLLNLNLKWRNKPIDPNDSFHKH